MLQRSNYFSRPKAIKPFYRTNLQIEDQHKKEHIVFLGENGFPKGLAAIQRMTLMAKALLHEGCAVTVICRKGVWEQDPKERNGIKGNHEGIDYIYTSESVFKPTGFFNRNIQKLKGLRGEYKYLKALQKRGELDIAIISNMSAFHLLRYLCYSAFLKFPVILNFVEMASAMQDRRSMSLKVNDYLSDKWLIKYFDGALPISDKLFNYYEKVTSSKPSMKLPILCDFKKFEVQPNKQEIYLLYCGSIAYKEVIDFVLEAFKISDQKNHSKLYMIISGGSKEETQQLQEQMNKGLVTDTVRLFANIPYSQLVDLYTNAIGLLIPLRPTLQDASRFPHKIGEYLASGNPVVTTDVGEIKNYFEDGKTALIADEYTIKGFAEKMQFVLENSEKAKIIGLNGKELGLNEFDYRTQGRRLKTFLRAVLEGNEVLI